jgi:hypothetical protein
MKPKEIAARLRTLAASFPETPVEVRSSAYSFTLEPIEVFRHGTFIVRCLPFREAVERVAAKFERGSRVSHGINAKLRKPSLKRPPNADITLATLIAECGETIEE